MLHLFVLLSAITTDVPDIAKLSQSSSSSWAELALFSANPTTHLTPTQWAKIKEHITFII